MNNAIERLAAELMKLSDAEWARLTALRINGQIPCSIFEHSPADDAARHESSIEKRA